MPRPPLCASPLALAVLTLGLSCGPLHAQTRAPLDLLQRFLPAGNKTNPAPVAAPTQPAYNPAPSTAANTAANTATSAPPSMAAPADAAPQPEAATPIQPSASDTPASNGTGVAPVTLGCRPLTDQALSADLKSATAQQQKADPTEQARLLDSSIALWAQAVTQCDGRSKDRAQRNLSDSIKARATLQDLLGSDPQCANAQKNATSLQDLARQAFGERRWTEAAALYRKAEDQWDVATERCTGTAQDVAQRRREQAEIDGYNAEFCAPVYDKAREVTQRTRTLAPGMSREEKQDALQLSETLWRDALGVCKGPALDTARSSAQALARERGTPWVDTRQAPGLGNLGQLTNLVNPSQLTNLRPNPAGATPTNAAATASNTNTSNTPTPTARVALPVANSAALASTALSAGSAAVNTAAGTAAGLATSAVPSKAMPSEFTAGTARFTGQFSLDAGGNTYSGKGRILWANGDIYEGTLVRGQKHGQGRFSWANGQRYDGDWFQDKPHGKANVQFANGNVYNGTVIDGIPNGQGRMVYTGGEVYVGELKNGYPDGRGTQTWPNGQRYEGEWQQQQPNGQGRMQFATGEVYSGQFSNGTPNGEGSFTWPSGDQYTGQWLMGKKHGQGVFTWKSGDRWEGLYDQDQQTAQGKSIPK